jgi:acyl dehydratase
MLQIDGPDHLRALVGSEIGLSKGLLVDQPAVDDFAEVTADRQWIHVDVDGAADGPFSGTIVHGLFTLSLGPRFSFETYAVEGFGFGLNYGYERVRFPAPFPVGGRLRMRATLIAADDVSGGIQMVVRQTFEAEGLEKPVCVADAVTRWIL